MERGHGKRVPKNTLLFLRSRRANEFLQLDVVTKDRVARSNVNWNTNVQ